MPVKIDSRKFLSVMNDSAQAKVALFEERIAEMGKKAGKNWRLTALQAKHVYFEDVDTNTYYIAEHSKINGQVKISGVDRIEITEGEKKQIFSESCGKLINALESNNQKDMAVAFDKMKAQRFSGRAVPYSGMVKCRDGVLRNIPVSVGGICEDDKNSLVAAIVEGLRNQVVIEEGRVVEGYFNDGEKFKLPVSKWGARKLVARRMRDAASNAFWSEGFQTRIKNVASLVAEGKIEHAVKYISPFLTEMEEFTLLTKKQTKALVENALAAKGIFNGRLCEDTATLFYRTNMKLNKSRIVSEWKNIAKVAEHPVLVENVHILSESKNFENDVDKFLSLIFEAISNRDVAAEALATTLQAIREKTPKIRESHDLSSKLNGLINRLKQPNFDDASIYEAEDLIATIQEELAATDTLSNFDKIPGSEDDGFNVSDDGLDEPAAPSGAPVININSPLIQIGGSSSAADGGGAGDLGIPDDLGTDETGEEEGGDLDSLLGSEDPTAAPVPTPSTPQSASQPAVGQPLMQSKERGGKPIGEGKPAFLKDIEDDDDDEATEESADPYALRDGSEVVSSAVREYGEPVIRNERDLSRIASLMQKLAVEGKFTRKALAENIETMAKASIEAVGLRIPEHKLPEAIEQCCNFFEEWKKPWLKDEDGDDDKDDDDDEGVAEDQFKSPRIKKRGFARSSIGSHLKESAIRWLEKEQDAILGEYNGVKFIFDHGTNLGLPPVLLSEDGAIEVPIPETLCESAFAAARMQHGDQRPFIQWLDQSIDQFGSLVEDDRALNEAIATIHTGPDGSLSVEVTPDVQVDQVDDGGMEGDDGMGGEGMDDGMGGEAIDGDELEQMGDDSVPPPEGGMQPVDSIDTGAAEGGEEMGGEGEDDGAMPNFEGGGETEEPAPEQGQGNPHDEDDGGMFEDKDITQPTSADYTKHVKDDKRKQPEVKQPSWSNNKLDEIGPELKEGDKSGGNPPTAKKISKE